jgi:RHS repeat-associated protein
MAYGSMSITGTTTNSYTFTGRETDGLGIDYYRARYYNPATGRFLSEDPIGFKGSGPNLYAYTYDDPVNFVDPTGDVGFGISGGGSLEGGLVGVGAGVQGSVGGGGFLNTNNWSPSASGFASGGAYAGGGGGLWLSNANNVGDLSGPFTTYSLNAAWFARALTLQYSVGKNAAGQTIGLLYYGGPLGFPTGGGWGFSLSKYNTYTKTSCK